MKCYSVGCQEAPVAFFIDDDVVACENHAAWDYFRYFDVLVLQESCPCFMGGSCPTDYKHKEEA